MEIGGLGPYNPCEGPTEPQPQQIGGPTETQWADQRLNRVEFGEWGRDPVEGPTKPQLS